jgi:hypothetical protein
MARWRPSARAARFIKKNAGKIPDLWIARRLHLSPHKVSVVREELGVHVHVGRPRTPIKRVKAILGLRRKGVKVVAIAKRYGVSRQRIYQVLERNLFKSPGGCSPRR